MPKKIPYVQVKQKMIKLKIEKKKKTQLLKYITCRGILRTQPNL